MSLRASAEGVDLRKSSFDGRKRCWLESEWRKFTARAFVLLFYRGPHSAVYMSPHGFIMPMFTVKCVCSVCTSSFYSHEGLFWRQLYAFSKSQRHSTSSDVTSRTNRDWRAWPFSLSICRFFGSLRSEALADSSAGTNRLWELPLRLLFCLRRQSIYDQHRAVDQAGSLA